ncbi:hypothetical protein ACJO5Y_01830 [Marinobacter sp. GN3S48]|uniref:hypothetical protein n=1 Tax=Marinobacter sp. GN3S48 TaxID=3382302 RepID=UPI00387A8B38
MSIIVDMKIVIAICIVLNLLGVLCSAFYWKKNPKLRTAPIIFTTISGFIYAVSNPEIVGFLEVVKVVGVSILIGFGFYFSVWFQCKD